MLVMADNFLQLFFWLGSGRRRVLLAHRLLVPTRFGDSRQPESVSRQSSRRFWFLAGHCSHIECTPAASTTRTVFAQAPELSTQTIVVWGTPSMVLVVGHLHPLVRWRHGQVRAGSLACLATGFDGGSDADFRAYSRRDNGLRPGYSWWRACRRCSSIQKLR